MTSSQGQARTRVSGAWLADAAAQAVFAAIARGGFAARAVGGAVRNALLGLAVTDVDIATDAPPQDVIRLAAAAGLRSVPTGLDHGTVTVISGGQPFEVTTLRRDVASDGRHAEVAFTSDWAADAGRRDFTINALYCDADGTVFDPLGGAADLDPVRVRFIGDARQRIREDYLRILRFFRFSAAYTAEGALDAEGFAACRAKRAGLSRISGERIQAELFKLLVARHAASVTVALVESEVFAALFGLAAHPGDFQRIVAIEGRFGVAADPVRRLAVLAIAGPQDVAVLDRRLKLAGADRDRLMRIAAQSRDISPALSEEALKERAYRWGVSVYEDAALVAWARLRDGADDPSWMSLAGLPQRFTPPRFPLSGHDLMGLGYREGPALGEALKRLEDAWIAAGFALGRAELLARARLAAPHG